VPDRLEVLRIARRLRNASNQYRALQVASAAFGEGFGKVAWQESFESEEADEINRVMQVVGDFEHLVNNLIETLKAGARIANLIEGRRPPAAAVIEAVHDDDGLSAHQVELLSRLYIVRSRLQHASPDGAPGEVREYVLLLLNSFPNLMRSIVSWLATHGVVVGDGS
jgi:hypothetical protein